MLEKIKMPSLRYFVRTLSFITLIGSLNGCGGSRPLSVCAKDADCPGQELCINNACSGSCYTDQDCPGDMICNNRYCASNTTSVPAQMPEEVYQGFAKALAQGKVEESLQYFDPQVRERYQSRFSRPDVAQIADKLLQIRPVAVGTGKNFREYEIELDGEESPIQFIRMYENGQEVWKISRF